MKHLDKFGRIKSEELSELVDKIDSMVAKFLVDVDPIEAACICRHLEGTIGYQASKRCIVEIMKEEESNGR